MLISDIQAELDRLAPMITAKGIRAPEVYLQISANSSQRFFVSWWTAYQDYRCKSFDTCADLATWIDALPTPEVMALRDHNDRLAKVIDAAREDGIPDEYVTPLLTVREALSSNLLTVAS